MYTMAQNGVVLLCSGTNHFCKQRIGTVKYSTDGYLKYSCGFLIFKTLLLCRMSNWLIFWVYILGIFWAYLIGSFFVPSCRSHVIWTGYMGVQIFIVGEGSPVICFMIFHLFQCLYENWLSHQLQCFAMQLHVNVLW